VIKRQGKVRDTPATGGGFDVAFDRITIVIAQILTSVPPSVSAGSEITLAPF
jgi:hypothetical protein